MPTCSLVVEGQGDTGRFVKRLKAYWTLQMTENLSNASLVSLSFARFSIVTKCIATVRPGAMKGRDRMRAPQRIPRRLSGLLCVHSGPSYFSARAAEDLKQYSSAQKASPRTPQEALCPEQSLFFLLPHELSNQNTPLHSVWDHLTRESCARDIVSMDNELLVSSDTNSETIGDCQLQSDTQCTVDVSLEEQGPQEPHRQSMKRAKTNSMLEVLRARAAHRRERQEEDLGSSVGRAHEEFLEHHSTPWDKLLEESQSAGQFPGKYDPFSTPTNVPIIFPDLEGDGDEISLQLQSSQDSRGSGAGTTRFTWGWSYHSPTGINMTRFIFFVVICMVPTLIYGFLNTDPACDEGLEFVCFFVNFYCFVVILGNFWARFW